MRKAITTLLLFIICITCFTTRAENRPKVAVVLSGGGAKGAAHVGALKVLEEVGIPVDIVVGTSMGSLAGGLYAYGYNAHQLDSILKAQDWTSLLTDKKKRYEVSFAERQQTDKYILSIKYNKKPTEFIEGGLLKGNNVSQLLCQLTADHLDSMDFRKLKIPFACVATDIATNQEIDLHSGILAESMRSSMSVPGVFAPVHKDSLILVDGGIVNNFPVDIARKMGADYVIGIDVSSPRKKRSDIKTAVDILSQIMDIMFTNKYTENVAKTDILVKVNVEGYGPTSFNKQAIDTLINRGEIATRSEIEQLLALKEKLGIASETVDPRPDYKQVNTFDNRPIANIYSPTDKPNFFGLGVRFDEEEFASILLGGLYQFNHKRTPKVYGEIRLGKRIWVKGGGKVSLGKNWLVDGGYQFSHIDSRIYLEGKHINNLEYNQHKVWAQFIRNWHKINFNLGMEFRYSSFADLLSAEEEATKVPSERAVLYYASAEFDNMDNRAFPTKGIRWLTRFEYFTDNGARYRDGMGLLQGEARLRIAIPLAKNSTLLPYISARFIPFRNEDNLNSNFIGGVNSYGHYDQHQMSFAGIRYMQYAPNLMSVVGVEFRQRFLKNHYAFGVANYGYGLSKNTVIPLDPITEEELIDQEYTELVHSHLFGFAVGYGYQTPIGPLEANFNWSNATKKVGFAIQLGYKF